MTEDSISADDALLAEFFAEAGWNEIAQSPPNQRRVEAVTERAISETIAKESSSFFFVSFASALASLLAALFGCVNRHDEDYKP